MKPRHIFDDAMQKKNSRHHKYRSECVWNMKNNAVEIWAFFSLVQINKFLFEKCVCHTLSLLITLFKKCSSNYTKDALKKEQHKQVGK